MKDCQYLWCTKRPFTYVIDYWWNHLNNPDYIKSVAQSPPNLLHVPQDVPFDSKWGPAGKYEGWDVEPTIYPITPEQMEQRIEDIKRFIKEIHNVGVVDLEMFEKNEGPGLIGKDIISHNILQYKFAWANHFCAGMLLYCVQNKDATELANAEAAAGGGGCFIQNGLGQPEVREKWRCFFENHDELLVGYDSASPVGVCFLYDQLWWDNWDHLREIFRLTDYLSARHIMFDYIVENSFKPNILARYQLTILPQCRYLSVEQIEWLKEFIEQGGGLILTGRCGIFDHEGKIRDIDPFADLFIEGKRDSKGIVLASYGRGMCARVVTLDPFISKRPFELFELSDKEREDTKNVLRLYEKAIGKIEENKQPWDGAFLKYANLLARETSYLR